MKKLKKTVLSLMLVSSLFVLKANLGSIATEKVSNGFLVASMCTDGAESNALAVAGFAHATMWGGIGLVAGPASVFCFGYAAVVGA